MNGSGCNGTWALTRLSTIARVVRERVKPQDNPALPFIGMDNVEPHTMRLLGTVSASTMKSASVKFHAGDVLYGRLRPYLNKVLAPAFEGLASAEFIPLTPAPGVVPKFLQYRVNAADFVAYASRLHEGDRPRVDYGQIGSFEIKLPPSDEQQRIVEAIESYFTRLDAAAATLERVQRNLKRYRASVLKAAVEGRLVPTEAVLARAEGRDYEPASVLLERILAERRRRWEEAELAKMKARGKVPKDDKWREKYKEPVAPQVAELRELPEGWHWASIDQLADHEGSALTDGPFGSNLKTIHYTDSGPRVIRLQNIGEGIFLDAEAHISPEHYEKLAKHAVEAGDVVIASLGQDLPRACTIPEWLGKAIVKADCLRFATHPGVMFPGYAVLALNSPESRKNAEDLIHGVGRPRIGLTLLRSFPLPLPPLIEQKRIVEEIERRQSLEAAIVESMRTTETRLGSLRQSILKWAFEGRLVDQDPTEESASVLLERIKAKRESIDNRRPQSRGRRKAKATKA